MSREKQDGLPEYIYARGQRLWMRYQDETGKWCKKRTPYLIDQVDQAARYVAAAMRAIEDRKVASSRDRAPGTTVRAYTDAWIKDREGRGISSVMDDRARLEHAFPHIGHLQLDEVRPRHIRDMMRELRTGSLAPRTIRHVYSTLHNLFENAVVEELIQLNPIKVKRGELPKKIDADPNGARRPRTRSTRSSS